MKIKNNLSKPPKTIINTLKNNEMPCRHMEEKELKEIYNSDYVNKYEGANSFRIKRLLNLIKFKKNDIVLDAGCGNGQLLYYIYKKINYYYGVDFSKEFIKRAIKKQKKKDISNSKFICSDIEKFCIKKKNYFNKIFTFDFSEHIYDYDFLRIFSKLYYSLKIGGTLYIHTPNGEYILELLKKKNIFKRQIEHIGIRKKTEYIKLLKKAGFNNTTVFFLPHYLKYLAFFDFFKYIPFIGKYFRARLFIVCKK